MGRHPLDGVSMEITGTTRLVGVFGWPVSHTLSPKMHNAAFAALGLDWAYLPLPVPPERVGDAVRGLPALGFAGANVTVPHKQAVLPFMDELTPEAQAIGAVNTIVVRGDSSLLGHSTDGGGFLADLARLLPPLHPDGTLQPPPWRTDEVLRALVLGAGGAARAIVYTLVRAGATVIVLNRTYARAQELCRSLSDALPEEQRDSLEAGSWDWIPHTARWADLVVNCTSLGLHEGDEMPWGPGVPLLPGQIVYDTIYNRPTELLAYARGRGATAVDGLGMLVQQGALAFEMWTGVPAPVDVMAAALK
jgi:shikimate dehydrogenase